MNSNVVNIKNIDINIANIDDLTEEINYIAEKEAIVINNVMFPIFDCLYIRLSELGQSTIECGKIIDNIYLTIKQNEDNYIIICDFSEVERISEDFCKSFAKLLLQSKSKIIPINMNTVVSTVFSKFIEQNLIEIEE